MNDLQVRSLDVNTWPDFAEAAERNNGPWNGCWCLEFHAEGARRESPEQRRTDKHRLVREGRAQAALVYDGPECVGWCQFGPADELPRIKRRRAYEQGLSALPDWRVTCLFVDKKRRRRGIAAAALDGALAEIARLGGGVVESYPEDVSGRSTSASLLHNGSVSMFEARGFERVRPLGKHHWVVSRLVAARDDI